MGLLASLGKQTAKEIRDWYVSRGYPESVADRIASGELPMDYESRMARALEQGYATRGYHGTASDISEFVPSADGMQGPGVYSASSPDVANFYAGQRAKEGGAANVIPIRIRGDVTDLSYVADRFPNTRVSDIGSIVDPLRAEGVTGLQRGNERVTFNPEDIRSSLSAAFDPEYTGPNILGSRVLYPGLLAGGLGLLGSEDAEAGFITRGGRTLLEAFHGSPHKFNRFDMSKIGTGEGAQAYGHGLYFADDENLAKAYRDTLKMKNDPREGINKIVNDVGLVAQGSQRVKNKKTGAIMTADPNNPVHQKILKGEIGSGDYEVLPASEGLMDSVVAAMRDDPRLAEFADNKDIVNDVVAVIRGQEEGGTVSDSALSAYRRIDQSLPEPTGALYRAEIDVTPDEMLDWDRPLSEQSELVQKALQSVVDEQRRIMSGRANIYTSPVEDIIARRTGGDWLDYFGGVDGTIQRPEDISARLNELGVKGIRYLDGNSRGAGDGTSNYVIFDDGLINIAERGFADPRLLAGMAGGGLLASAAPSLYEYSQERALQAANEGLLSDAMTVDEQADLAHRRRVNERMSALGLLQDPMYEYGTILPQKTNIATGETSLAFPEFVQGIARGLLDIGSTRDTKRYNPAALLEVL